MLQLSDDPRRKIKGSNPTRDAEPLHVVVGEVCTHLYIYKIYIFGNKERRKSSATGRSGQDPDDGGDKNRCHRCQGHCIGCPLGSQIDDHRVLILQPWQWNYLPSWLLPTSVLLNIDLRPCSLHVGQGVGSGS